VIPITLTATILALFARQTAIGDPNDAVFQGALVPLSQQQTVFLQLNGSITFHGKSTPMITNLSWSNTTVGTTQNLQVDLESYVNGVLVKRFVGDGYTFWTYDLVLHQYSATPYGGTPGLGRPTTYASDLMNDLNWAASGANGYLTKLLRQICTPPSPNWTSWMPGVNTYQMIQGLQIPDPINPNVVYYPSASSDYYLYNASPKRTIVIQIAPALSTNGGGQPVSGLQNIYFNEVEMLQSYPRLTQWVITPYSGITFAPDLFTPYSGASVKGWRPVVAPKAVTS